MPAFLLPTTHLLELAVRAVVVYGFLLAALRLAGRRELGQLTSFDLVLLLLISNAVQNSINAGDNSLGAGLVSALVLVVLNKVVGWAAWRWRWAERLLQGRPIRVVTDGKVHLGALKKEQLTFAELRSALRKQGIDRISDCAKVVLEPDGTLSVLRVGDTPHTAAEMAHPQPMFEG